jgi:hypothetical protein
MISLVTGYLLSSSTLRRSATGYVGDKQMVDRSW